MKNIFKKRRKKLEGFLFKKYRLGKNTQKTRFLWKLRGNRVSLKRLGQSLDCNALHCNALHCKHAMARDMIPYDLLHRAPPACTASVHCQRAPPPCTATVHRNRAPPACTATVHRHRAPPPCTAYEPVQDANFHTGVPVFPAIGTDAHVPRYRK